MKHSSREEDLTNADKTDYLSAIFETDGNKIVPKFLEMKQGKTKNELINMLYTYIELLRVPLNTGKTSTMMTSYTQIRSHLCQVHTKSTAEASLSRLASLIRFMMKYGWFKGFTLPDRINDDKKYALYKSETIPPIINAKIKHKVSAPEAFKNLLKSHCTSEIARRLIEHVGSFKHEKHHRAPLAEFLKQIFTTDPLWYQHPLVIQAELLKFRNNLVDKQQRNTAYGRFQNVKNALSVLVEHQLLPKDTNFPDNLRRCVNTQKVRSDNPLLSNTDLYNDKKKKEFADTSTFISNLITDLSDNLNTLLTTAREIVYEGYHKFLAKENMVAKSQRCEFLNHPDLLVNRDRNINSYIRSRKFLNPFYKTHPLRDENLIGYFDYFFDSLVDIEIPHERNGLAANQNTLDHLGLTPLVASAMQIIIVGELGLNPYSLYNIKVSSNSHGYEFVKVTDEGSVRLRALKLRARKVRIAESDGSLSLLSGIDKSNINAATCLKMALEMSFRARETKGTDDLWTCLTFLGINQPTPSTFQNSFKSIRSKIAIKNVIFNSATLKKVRTSKGVLIYLTSNGDSLKTASYFGNSVKTTLGRYIPSYLTELVYRVKIRSFQNILLYMAMSTHDSPAETLDLSVDEFNQRVKKAFSNPDMGGSLYAELTNNDTGDTTSSAKYFCLSDANIGLAIKYAKVGTDKQLKTDCMDVLSKIAEGPVIMKQMLRNAQIKYDENLERLNNV